MNRIENLKSNILSSFTLPQDLHTLAHTGPAQLLVEGNRDPTEEEVLEMRQAIGDILNLVRIQLAGKKELAEELSKSLVEANKRLSVKNRKVTFAAFLKADEAFKEAFAVLNEIGQDQKHKKSLVMGIGIAGLIYPLLLFVLSRFSFPETMLGTPRAVFVWGLLGGYAAVLFSYLTLVDRKWRVELKLLWIALRPVLGSLMGALLYLFLVTALLVFSSEILPSEIRPQVAFLLAFIGGTSDKLWITLAKLVIGPLERNGEAEQ